MTDFAFLADDGLVDALIMEVAGLLQGLVEHGEAGIIDLLGLPLSPSCVAALEQRLGPGEITVQLDAAGRSEIRETGFPGVWWTRHADEAGRVIALLIEVAFVPAILRADVDDMTRGHQRLLGCTNAARHARRTAA
jgi:hydrogenase-1 operon protein HyaF